MRLLPPLKITASRVRPATAFGETCRRSLSRRCVRSTRRPQATSRGSSRSVTRSHRTRWTARFECRRIYLRSLIHRPQGYHPVCVMGTQIKILSKFEDDSSSVDPRGDGTASSAAREGGIAELSGLLAAGVARQWGSVKRNWGAVSERFPQKLYLSSTRLSRSCQKMAVRITREVSRAWRDLWR